MNNNLKGICLVERATLSEEHYLLSLLDAARDKGLLVDSDIERIRQQCLALLAGQVERFNAGGSSSIRVEKATDILSSVFFVIGVWLKSCPTPDAAAAALLREPVQSLYEQGLRRIGTLLASSKATHRRLVRQLMETPNVFYHATLVDGMLGFFKLYNPDFAAQQIHITADYPLFNPRPKLAGIEFIHTYLGAAYYENLFCTHFPADCRHRLLSAYLKDYAELPINLYEVVLTAALGCVVAGTNPCELDVTPGRLDSLCRSFAATDRDGTAAILAGAVDALCRGFGLSPGLAHYLRDSLPLVAVQLAHAAQNGALHRVFVLPHPADAAPTKHKLPK